MDVGLAVIKGWGLVHVGHGNGDGGCIRETTAVGDAYIDRMTDIVLMVEGTVHADGPGIFIHGKEVAATAAGDGVGQGISVIWIDPSHSGHEGTDD